MECRINRLLAPVPGCPAGKLAPLADQAPGGVYLMAATLRPETMYGQTNCWALPEGKYGAFRGLEGEVYIMTERSALNLSYQVGGAAVAVGGGGTGGGDCTLIQHFQFEVHTMAGRSARHVLLLTPAVLWCPVVCPMTNFRFYYCCVCWCVCVQERTPKRGEPECLLQLTGQDLIGLPLSSPNTDLEIYVLPLLTILTNKGTGIVTSVPSDSPDDYIALQVTDRGGGSGGVWTCACGG